MRDLPPDADVTSVAEELLESLVVAEVVTPIDVPGGLMGVLYRIRVGIEQISTWSGSLAWVLAWVVFLLGLFNVVTRYVARFIERDIIVGEIFDLQWMMFGALFLLAFNYGVRESVNPRIDFWWANFSAKRKAVIDLVFHVTLFAPFLWMSITILYPWAMISMGRSFDGTWATWRVWEIWEQSGDAGGLPRGPIKVLMLAGMILFLLQIIAEIIKNFFVLRDRGDLAGIHSHKAPTRIE